jgi:hypothetical protein
MTPPTPSMEKMREDFHKFSVFMAEARQAGELEMKDIEKTICDYWLLKLSEALENQKAKLRKMIEIQILDWSKGSHHTNIATGAVSALKTILSSPLLTPITHKETKE